MDAARLDGLGPFTDLDPAGRERVAALLEVRAVPAGTVLVTAGAPVPGLAFLLSGEALVHGDIAGRDHDLARLGRGAFVGELSLLDHRATASATVTVTRDAELAVPVTGHGEDLLDDPVVGAAVRDVARRRRATNRVAALGPVRTSLADGTPIDLRPMWPDDWHLMDAGRGRVSRESLHQRFFSIPKLTEPLLRRLATVDFVTDFAWIALAHGGAAADHTDDLLGVGRYARLGAEPEVAEIALLVTDDLHGRGLGTRLLAALAVAADEHGVTTFEALALADNRAIQRLVTAAGATWHRTPEDPTHVETRWPVATTLARLGAHVDLPPLRALVRHALAEDPA